LFVVADNGCGVVFFSSVGQFSQRHGQQSKKKREESRGTARHAVKDQNKQWVGDDVINSEQDSLAQAPFDATFLHSGQRKRAPDSRLIRAARFYSPSPSTSFA
jgi:hypothetical protein